MYEVSPDALTKIIDDNDEQQVRTDALETNYLQTDVIEATIRVAKVLLLLWKGWDKPEVDFPNRTNTLMEQWIVACQANNQHHYARHLIKWLTAVRVPHAYYPIFLFNRNMWRSNEFLNFILTDNEAPPYLVVFLLNLFRQALGISHTQLHHMLNGKFTEFVPCYKELMTTNALWDWAARRKQSFFF
ncbi:MAG: hypothetical protein K2Q32_03930, partial [Alphaproteobacteria bacterium]|nr:hypothetical protein [Alphaproteobacteria bacterium]